MGWRFNYRNLLPADEYFAEMESDIEEADDSDEDDWHYQNYLNIKECEKNEYKKKKRENEEGVFSASGELSAEIDLVLDDKGIHWEIGDKPEPIQPFEVIKEMLNQKYKKEIAQLLQIATELGVEFGPNDTPLQAYERIREAIGPVSNEAVR